MMDIRIPVSARLLEIAGLVDRAHLVSEYRGAVLSAVACVFGTSWTSQEREGSRGANCRVACNPNSLPWASAGCRLAGAAHVSHAQGQPDDWLRSGLILRSIAGLLDVGRSGAIFLFGLSPYLTTRLHGYYLLPLGYSLDNLAIAYLLLYAVRNRGSAFGRVLNHRLIVHVGVISYSLYLWQQLFLGLWPFPWGVLGSFLAAELSWRIVETPALRLRDRLMEHRELAVVA